MNRAPRLSLRTLFLLFFCAAVGLAIDPTPTGALEPAITTAIVIGLIQQVRQLSGWRPSANERSNAIESARQYAITWRVFIAAVISMWMIFGMLVRQGMFQLPDHDELWFYLPYQAVLPLCLVVVMCSSLARWQSASPFRTKRGWRAAGLWAFGVLIGIILLIDGTIAQYLVHKAVAGIEAAQVYRRPGVYPNLGVEQYRPIWLASAAVVSFLTAAAVLVWSSNRRNDWRMLAMTYFLFPSLLIPPSLFSYWYYTAEFHRLSPEMAGAGLAANWIDWLMGAILAVGLVATCAYQLSSTRQQKAEIAADLSQNVERTAFHESFFCLALIGIHAIYTVGLHIASGVSAYLNFRGRWPPLWNYLTMLCNPLSLLSLALLIVTAQLCWLRWRRRSETVAWKIDGLSRLAFLRNSAALTLLLIVGVPTLHAFTFILWLGPWNLLPLFGF
jgi:hypothetical protein